MAISTNKSAFVATSSMTVGLSQMFTVTAGSNDPTYLVLSSLDRNASLPAQSTAIGIPGKANGEWIVAFNGLAGQSGNRQSLVHTGEIVVIDTSGGGHITTCVSGSSSTAMLVDNITYVNSQGKITNPANDGSSRGIIVAAPHIASQEWSGVQSSSVVIYELDTPVVSTTVVSDSLACLATQSLGSHRERSDQPGDHQLAGLRHRRN